jgi:DNA-directed RNA polymerase I, II, and III subunit RPABC1
MKEQIVRSMKTIVEMLQDRNLSINVTPEHFEGLNPSNTIFEITFPSIKIIYYLANKFKWTDIKPLFDQEVASEAKKGLYLLVVRDKINQSNMKSINSRDLPLQIFSIQELQFNISKHVLVPKHEKVPPEEVPAIVEKLSIKSKHQLPLILKTDPMSRYLNLKAGDVVRITRPSATAGEYITYRCCV